MADGAKGRKFGRCKKSPSQKNYKAGNKQARNKRLAAERVARHLLKMYARFIVPRGTARIFRRDEWSLRGHSDETFQAFESRIG